MQTQGPKTPGAAMLTTFLQTGNAMMSEGPRLAQLMFSRVAGSSITSARYVKATAGYRIGLLRAALQAGCTSRSEAEAMATIVGLGGGKPNPQTEGFLTNAPGQVCARKSVNISPGQPAGKCLAIRYKLLTSIATEDIWQNDRGANVNQNPDGPTHNISQFLGQAILQPAISQELAALAPRMAFNCGDVGVNCQEEYGYYRAAGQKKGVNPACMNQQETPSVECINDLTVAAVQSVSDHTCRERNVNGAQCTSALAANFGALQTIRGQKPSCGAVGGSASPIQDAVTRLYAYIDSKEFRTFLASLTPEDLKRIDVATNDMLARDRRIMLAALEEWRDEYKTYYARLVPEPASPSLAELFASAGIHIRSISGATPISCQRWRPTVRRARR